MSDNAREGSLGMRHVVAGATRVAGVPVIEQGFVGFPETDAATGVVYAMDCRVGSLYVIPKVGAEAKGDYIWLTVASNVLSLTGGAGKRRFAKVVEAENGAVYGTPAGSTLVELQPQTVTE